MSEDARIAESESRRLAAAREAWRGMEKLVRGAMGADAEVTRRLVAHALEQLQGFLQAHGELGVSLTPENAYLEGTKLTEHEHAEANPLYFAFRDGLRRLVLEPGLDDAELQRLVQAFRQAGAGAAEDDAITLLWSADLEHVRYHEVEPFTADGAEADAQTREIRELADRASAAAPPPGPAAVRPRAIGRAAALRWQLPAPDQVAAALAAPLEAIPAALRADAAARLGAAVAALSAEPFLVDRYLHVLLRSLADPAAHEVGGIDTGVPADAVAAGAAVEIFGAVAEQLVERGELRQAAEVLGRVDAVLGDDRLPAYSQAAAALRKRLAGERLIGLALAAHKAAGGAMAPDAAALLWALPGTALRRLLELAGAERDPAARGRALEDLLGSPRRDELLDAAAEVLVAAPEAYALQLLKALAALGDDRVRPILDRAARHPHPHVRFEAFFWALCLQPREDAERRAVAALKSPDVAFRRLAVEYLVETRSPLGARRIREAVAVDLDQYEVGDRQRLCVALVDLLGRDAVPVLLRVLDRRNLVGSPDVDHSREAAAAGLGMSHAAEAREPLQRVAASRLTRKPLREACEQALGVLGQPPAPKTVELLRFQPPARRA